MHCAYNETTYHIVPEALTSAVMKVCERVVLCKLEKLVKDYLDSLQFGYRKNRSTDDAVIYSLENTYSHLEEEKKKEKKKKGKYYVLRFFQCL